MDLPLDSAVDQPILTALRTGQHRRAATLMIGSYGPAVLRLCRLTTPAADADDLANDCFARAFASFPEFRATESPRAWLLAIAAARCLEQLEPRFSNLPEPPASDAAISFHGDPSVAPETVKAAFERLPDQPRAMLGLCLDEALDPAASAGRGGLELDAHRRLLLAALADLAADVGADGPASPLPAGTPQGCFPRLLGALKAMYWRPSASLARRLDVLATAL